MRDGAHPSRPTAPGFPDLLLVHPERQLLWFRELKSATGRLTLEQQNWGRWLREARCNYEVWRPSMWEYIVESLSHGRAAP